MYFSIPLAFIKPSTLNYYTKKYHQNNKICIFNQQKRRNKIKKYLGQHLISIILTIALTGATHVAFDTCWGAIAIETFFVAATFRQLRA